MYIVHGTLTMMECTPGATCCGRDLLPTHTIDPWSTSQFAEFKVDTGVGRTRVNVDDIINNKSHKVDVEIVYVNRDDLETKLRGFR